MTLPWRWPVGLFFSLFVIPFVIVWALTDGRELFITYFPVYEIESVGSITREGHDISLRNVVVVKLRDCRAEGPLLASLPYEKNGMMNEIMAPVEVDGTGVPVVLTNKKRAGDRSTVEHWRIHATSDIWNTTKFIRLVLPCHYKWLGYVKTYTNPIPMQ